MHRGRLENRELLTGKSKRADEKRGRQNMEKKLKFTVGEADWGIRLEHILRFRMGLSRREISRAKFLEGGICVDRIPRKVNYEVKAGEQVEVLLEEKQASSAHLIPAKQTLRVRYEDEDVIVMEKPAGLVVHPAGGHYTDTLANRLAAYLREKQQDCVIRIMGRLDKDTSGLVLAVKNKAAASRLERQRQSGEFYKTYLAVTQGIPHPECGRIEKPIACDREQKGKMCIDAAGKQALTQYEVIEKSDREALVRVRIFTGRTHQIRVHMAFAGCPLKGDVLYGRDCGCGIIENDGSVCGDTGRKKSKKDCGCKIKRKEQTQAAQGVGTGDEPFRLALHAHTLHFRQPFTGEEIIVTAPISEKELGYAGSAGAEEARRGG